MLILRNSYLPLAWLNCSQSNKYAKTKNHEFIHGIHISDMKKNNLIN